MLLVVAMRAGWPKKDPARRRLNLALRLATTGQKAGPNLSPAIVVLDRLSWWAVR